MTNLLIREWLNGGLIPLNVCIIVIISYQLFRTWQKHGWGWTHEPGVSSACALWWIFVADLIRSCLAWSLLHAQAQGRPMLYLGYGPTMLYITAAGIAVLATFRLIYTLSPEAWGHKGWIAAAGLTAAFMTVITLID